MRRSRQLFSPGRLAAAIGLLLLAPVAGGAAAPSAAPRLVFEAPDSLRSAAIRLQAIDPGRLRAAVEIVGLEEAGGPIRVVLAAEDSEAARAAPPWVSGYAYGALGVVVVFPGRTLTYPDSSLDELLLHEITHVLVARAAAGRPVPRWFNEGLAMYVGHPLRLEDRSRITWALWMEDDVPLAELDARFAAGRGAVARAYALSGAFVHDLFRRHGSGVAARILSQVSLGAPFPAAFERATGLALTRAESSFWKRHSLWYRWVPVLTSSLTLWTGITLLALVAIRRRRTRDAEMRKMWEEEERFLSPPPPTDPVN